MLLYEAFNNKVFSESSDFFLDLQSLYSEYICFFSAWYLHEY